MKQALLSLATFVDFLAYAALIAGLLIPPWNIVWFACGYLLFFVLPSLRGPRHMGSGSWQLAGLALPGILTAAPFWGLAWAIRKLASKVICL
jgi:hypothetical protein